MRRIVIVTAATALLAACGDSGGADTNADGEITAEEMAAEAASEGDMPMRPGEWEQTMQFTEVNMPGMPEGMENMIMGQLGSGVSVKHCITEEQAREPTADMFSGEGQEDCTFEEFNRSGNTMTMRMVCADQMGGTATVAMNGEFSAEAYTMDVDTQMSGGPQGDMSMKGKITARRIGDCS